MTTTCGKCKTVYPGKLICPSCYETIKAKHIHIADTFTEMCRRVATAMTLYFTEWGPWRMQHPGVVSGDEFKAAMDDWWQTEGLKIMKGEK